MIGCSAGPAQLKCRPGKADSDPPAERGACLKRVDLALIDLRLAAGRKRQCKSDGDNGLTAGDTTHEGNLHWMDIGGSIQMSYPQLITLTVMLRTNRNVDYNSACWPGKCNTAVNLKPGRAQGPIPQPLAKPRPCRSADTCAPARRET